MSIAFVFAGTTVTGAFVGAAGDALLSAGGCDSSTGAITGAGAVLTAPFCSISAISWPMLAWNSAASGEDEAAGAAASAFL